MTPQPAAILQDGISALGLDLDARAQGQLIRFVELLARWGTVYNLTSLRDPSEVVTRHILDCLALIRPLQRWTSGLPRRVLDVGSGAGLPGVVLAIVRPELAVSCVDTVRKKAAFITQVKGALGLDNLISLHRRVEDLTGQHYDAVTARAFAALPQLVALTDRALTPAGVWIAMKGQTPTEEIAALPSNIEMFHVEQLTVPHLDAARCIVWMRRAEAARG